MVALGGGAAALPQPQKRGSETACGELVCIQTRELEFPAKGRRRRFTGKCRGWGDAEPSLGVPDTLRQGSHLPGTARREQGFQGTEIPGSRRAGIPGNRDSREQDSRDSREKERRNSREQESKNSREQESTDSREQKFQGTGIPENKGFQETGIPGNRDSRNSREKENRDAEEHKCPCSPGSDD